MAHLTRWAGKLSECAERIGQHGFWLGAVIVTAVVAVIYYPALRVGFWSDDYMFLELAGRLPLLEYVAKFVDPRSQVLWYRPIEGALWWIEWQFFRTDPLGYHVVECLLHLANCLLLLHLAARVSRSWPVGFVAALIYCGLSVYGPAVYWPADPSVLATCFYLVTIELWLTYLANSRIQYQILALGAFLLALLSKEMSVTLPFMLFLIDRLLVGGTVRLSTLVRRYLPMVAFLVPYLMFEYAMQRESVFKSNLGYALGSHIPTILAQYAKALVFPWDANRAVGDMGLVVLALLYVLLCIVRKSRALLYLGLATLLVLIPVLPFGYVFLRYLYLPMMLPSILVAALGVWAVRLAAGRKWYVVGVAAAAVVAVIVVVNGSSVADATDGYDRFARENRLPLRHISQWHPTLPADTLLYFIDPPVPVYSGMFFARYGSSIAVGGDVGDSAQMWRPRPAVLPGLGDRPMSYVYYFDEHGEIRELRAQRENRPALATALPVRFVEPLTLEGYEVVGGQVKQGEAVVVLLVWQALGALPHDYSVFAHLVDAHGEMVAGYDSRPRGGQSPTKYWHAGDRVLDWVIVPVASNVPAGAGYRLEIGLYSESTGERLPVVDPSGGPAEGTLTVSPFTIVP